MTSGWAGAHGRQMRMIRLQEALGGTALVLALSGCGSTGSTTGGPAQDTDPSDGSSSIESSPGDRQERITPGGIAAVVLQHLGSDTVRRFVVYEPEPGSVSVMVRLRDATPHNFGVQVYSPRQAGMFGEAGTCPGARGREGEFRCRTLGNGTTVTTWEDAHGFSDDNADGMVISGSAVTPENGGALALYESYDDSPAISVADLEDLLTDPRLTWFTEPAVNRAGSEIDLKEIAG
jgi:hypothetical protein